MQRAQRIRSLREGRRTDCNTAAAATTTPPTSRDTMTHQADAVAATHGDAWAWRGIGAASAVIDAAEIAAALPLRLCGCVRCRWRRSAPSLSARQSSHCAGVPASETLAATPRHTATQRLGAHCTAGRRGAAPISLSNRIHRSPCVFALCCDCCSSGPQYESIRPSRCVIVGTDSARPAPP